MKKFILINSTSGSKPLSADSLVKLDESPSKQHRWVTVINPTNRRLLLQACDDCGVVKSENSIRKVCRAPNNSSIVSGCISRRVQLVG